MRTLCLAFSVSLFLFSGCMTKQGLVWPWTAERLAVERRMDSLCAEIGQRIGQLDSSDEARHVATRAELGNQIATNSDRTEVLGAKLDDFGSRLNRVPQRSVRPESTPSGADNSTTIYRQAYTDYTRGRYDLAIPGFQGFIRQFPGSDLADNAQYWLGECYYDTGQYDTALVQFRKVSDNYPESDKAPAALLKQGKCQENLHDNAKAADVYRQVSVKYPLAPEAKLAEEALKQLKP